MLRDYQVQSIEALRQKLYRENRKSVLLQLPTGSGKTVILSEIFSALYKNEKHGWFVVPRNELVRQASAHLAKWRVPHGIIDASHEESWVFNIHVVSKDTLIRRIDNIKTIPDLLVFDEAHIAIDGQKKIMLKTLDNPDIKYIGMTATPEREDGRGLSELYEDIIYGASIPYLTQLGYLAPLRYFAPPIEGIEQVRFRGNEADEKELDAIMTEKAVYGKAVEYYQKYGRKADGSYMRAIGFCHGVKAAEKQAIEFRKEGFKAESISGYMPKAKQRELIDGLDGGTIQVLINSDLLTYGFDSPKIEYGFSLRHTKSRALYFQIVGRILRTAPGKTETLFFDHTNNINIQHDERYPGVPLFYIDDLTWNFNGTEKRKTQKNIKPTVKLCIYTGYEVCTKRTACTICEQNTDRNKTGKDKQEIIENIPLMERHKSDILHIQQEINRHTAACKNAVRDDVIDKEIASLLLIAKKLNYSPLWVYHQVKRNAFTVDTPILWSIARTMHYKPGWVHINKRRLISSP